MIPHHSIAMPTSERATFSDPRVQLLANNIIEAQRLEIDEMRALITDLQGGPAATPELDGQQVVCAESMASAQPRVLADQGVCNAKIKLAKAVNSSVKSPK